MPYELKLKLAESIKEIMNSKSLDKISVKEIVDNAHVSRQSFYRNFQDKYDLVNWYFDILAMGSFTEMGKEKDLRNALISKFNYIRSESVFFIEAFKSTSYNSIMEHDYEFILDFYTNKLHEVFITEVPFELMFQLEFYCRGSIFKTLDWVLSGMKQSPEELADLLIKALPIELKEAFSIIL